MATNKQRRAAEIMAKDVTKPVKEAMLEAGYSDSYSKNPQYLTQSVGFQELLDEKLPDKDIIDTHKEALKAYRIVSARVTNKDADVDTDDFIEVPDFPSRLKAVELAYRAKGRLKDNIIDNRKQLIQIELTDETKINTSTITDMERQPSLQGNSGGEEIREDDIILS